MFRTESAVQGMVTGFHLVVEGPTDPIHQSGLLLWSMILIFAMAVGIALMVSAVMEWRRNKSFQQYLARSEERASRDRRTR